MAMNKADNDDAIEQMKKLNKARQIIELICSEAYEAEDGNDFTQWVIDHEEQWTKAIE